MLEAMPEPLFQEWIAFLVDRNSPKAERAQSKPSAAAPHKITDPAQIQAFFRARYG